LTEPLQADAAYAASATRTASASMLCAASAISLMWTVLPSSRHSLAET